MTAAPDIPHRWPSGQGTTRPAPRDGDVRRTQRGVVDSSGHLGTVLALAGLAMVGALAASRTARRRPRAAPVPRRLRQSAALLSASVLCDSAIEHFQGGYHNPAMYVGPGAAAATMIATMWDGGDPRRRTVTRDVQAAAALVGMAGLGFHTYNILRRPGGCSWNNMFYAAPIGAPGALVIAGLLGLSARRFDASHRSPAEARALAGGLGASLLATTAEVALLHFRGAFHNPAMFLPVTIPPAAGLALCLAAWPTGKAARRAPRHRATRLLLRLTLALGPIGTAFHVFGVSRDMGGWTNWRQNMLSGPPLPAPPSFSALALAGLAALRAVEKDRT